MKNILELEAEERWNPRYTLNLYNFYKS